MDFFEEIPVSVTLEDRDGNTLEVYTLFLQEHFFDFNVNTRLSEFIPVPAKIHSIRKILLAKEKGLSREAFQTTFPELFSGRTNVPEIIDLLTFLVLFEEKVPVARDSLTRNLIFRWRHILEENFLDFFIEIPPEILPLFSPIQFPEMYENLWREINLLSPNPVGLKEDDFEPDVEEKFKAFVQKMEMVSDLFGPLLSPIGQVTCSVIVGKVPDSFGNHVVRKIVQTILDWQEVYEDGEDLSNEELDFPVQEWWFLWKKFKDHTVMDFPVYEINSDGIIRGDLLFLKTEQGNVSLQRGDQVQKVSFVFQVRRYQDDAWVVNDKGLEIPIVGEMSLVVQEEIQETQIVLPADRNHKIRMDKTGILQYIDFIDSLDL